MDKYELTPKNIHICDETGIFTVQDPGEILAPKGMKSVESITSWVRGTNVTLLCTLRAAGGFVHLSEQENTYHRIHTLGFTFSRLLEVINKKECDLFVEHF
ncbi:hypothetical protein HHI36_006110 [Cryptolaemus montrouzieri]|uniref:Uncharacterized protein n=1 Tax=Cryptolaemus montrouzieri TaxID=559131 RepID=A0ABD2NW64_9CUCU